MIYLIATSDRRFCKIGKALIPNDRLAALQTASPHELELLATRAEPDAFERQCHAEFSDHHVRGEWFEMQDDTVRRFLNLECEPVDEVKVAESRRKFFDGIDIEEFRAGIDGIDSTVEKVKARIRLAIMDGESPATLARSAGIHRNALYACTDPDWDPKSSTLEKLERHLL